ncbi:hypothetical protein OMP38_23185 [Cohnella ginsengisoli]|uniref:Uncharacterized protein n=1 Tax=Cohnella ginsengisoli TaxID=425004 RepID=A0A9X4QPE1_9BACL|nr:hypothetical protein [Cohnella ginsengisoli]MDG0793417.1 hypothetical protein [Cohnella ginsengisoli]
MIDRLLLYIRVCQYLLSFDSKTENLEAVKQSINIMNNSFENYLITNIINSSGSNPSFKYNDKELCKVMKIIDLYTKGKYEEVKTEYQDIYQEMPERLEITLPFVKSITSLGENIIEYQNSTLLFNISEHLFNIITKNEQAQESYMGIQKLIDIYISCEWASQLQWILHTEYYPNQYDATAKKFIRFGLLNSISYNPYNILYWNTEIKELIFSYLEREHNDSVTYKFLYNISEKNDASIKVMDIPIHRKNRFLAQIFLQSGLVDRAYDLILSYADSENIIVKQHYITDYLNFLIKTNDYDKAIELVVDIYFSNSNLFVCMPIEEFLMKVEVEKPASIQSNICLPILYEIYSRNIKKDKDFYISESYEDYLILNGYERPSELGLTVGIDVKKIIYFFR